MKDNQILEYIKNLPIISTTFEDYITLRFQLDDCSIYYDAHNDDIIVEMDYDTGYNTVTDRILKYNIADEHIRLSRKFFFDGLTRILELL